MSVSGARVSRRFRVRSLAELSDRARQRVSVWLELFGGASRAREPGDDLFRRAVLSGSMSPSSGVVGANSMHWGSVNDSALSDPVHIGELVNGRFPDAAARIVERADRALSDRFDIFGHEGLSYGDPIDWHLDPLRNRRAPRVHWSRVPYLDVDLVGDHKVIWELNRHQHLVTLGQAYRLTGDERYAATVVRHLTEWMDANPPKLGINWSSSLELAFRAISWTWALHLTRSSTALSATFMTRLMKFLYLHARHIAAHLSTYFSPNTHLTGEALGLLYVGTCFGQFRDARRWRELGWSILERELSCQVHGDGIYFEQTTWYQRYTADFYLHALLLRERAGKPVCAEVRQRIGQIIEPLVHFTEPNGTTPLIGDDDGGQLLPLFVTRPNDFRATLAHAAVAFGRGDCAALAADGAAALPWLYGASGLATFDVLERRWPVETARLFESGGYFVARDRWAPDADYLLVDCGPHGSLSCGHSHADALSLELTLRGVSILVDPGTYSYAQPERDEFRTTAAHNAVTIDDQPSSVPDRPFRWRTAAACTISHAMADQHFAFFAGEHDGFMRLADAVRYRRAIFAVFGGPVAVVDTIEATGTHTVSGRYHFSPGLSITAHAVGPGLTVSDREQAMLPLLDLFVFGADVSVGLETGRVAPSYGISTAAGVGVYKSRGSGSRDVWTVIVPRDGSRTFPEVRAATVSSGRIVTLTTDRYEDVIAGGNGGISHGGIATDARWIWVRRDSARDQPMEFILIDGSNLSIDGAAIMSLSTRRQHVRGRWRESGWDLDASPV